MTLSCQRSRLCFFHSACSGRLCGEKQLHGKLVKTFPHRTVSIGLGFSKVHLLHASVVGVLYSPAKGPRQSDSPFCCFWNAIANVKSEWKCCFRCLVQIFSVTEAAVTKDMKRIFLLVCCQHLGNNVPPERERNRKRRERQKRERESAIFFFFKLRINCNIQKALLGNTKKRYLPASPKIRPQINLGSFGLVYPAFCKSMKRWRLPAHKHRKIWSLV